MKSRRSLLTVLIILIVLGVFSAGQAQADRPPLFDVGMQPPNFTLEDEKGRPVNLIDETKKQPVLLVFYRGYW